MEEDIPLSRQIRQYLAPGATAAKFCAEDIDESNLIELTQKCSKQDVLGVLLSETEKYSRVLDIEPASSTAQQVRLLDLAYYNNCKKAIELIDQL